MKGVVAWTAAWLFAASSAAGQVVDVSYDQKTPERRQSIQFQAMDVIAIDVTTGQRAVVQFTVLGSRHGTYRWRYRRSGSSEVLSGVGNVAEKYEEIPDSKGRGHVLPLPGNDTIVRMGELRAAWSWADERSAFLYYHPRRARVKLLPAGSFEREP
jgi:hypothetical protein